MMDWIDYLHPVAFPELDEESGYTDGQYAKKMLIYVNDFPDLDQAELVILGIRDMRGAGLNQPGGDPAGAIRREFYRLHDWHPDLKIADIGDVRTGTSLADTHAAVTTILSELQAMGKTTILIGGTHDFMMAQYEACKSRGLVIEATSVDARINLRGESPVRSENFLLDMLTGEPNMVKHYNHIAFQSYFVHPRMLETMDKLRFDCYRAGMVREHMEEMEPAIRSSHILGFDISAIRHSDAPANVETPNGLSGEEACMLTRYAGMSARLLSIGFYGYQPSLDHHSLTARQMAQMLWYFIEGRQRRKFESELTDLSAFNEFRTAFSEVETLFLQSRKTSRWWMQMPDRSFAPCTYDDYVKASMNEIPERWLRIQERN